MSTMVDKPLRRGEVAQLPGTTPRTIRYYEGIGLLPGSGERAQGQHRAYSRADVDRVKEIVRLRDLLGLSLEQLSKLLEAETARAELRREYQETDDAATQRRILEEALGHIADQLELVSDRRRELQKLERELHHKHQSVEAKLGVL